MIPVPLPVSVGVETNTIWLLAEPSVWPEPAVKLTVAPALRVRLPKVRAAFWPLPLVTLTVELPPPSVRAPEVWLDAAVLLPRKLKVPPLSVMVAAATMRVGLLAVVLSSVSVPPVLTVMPETALKAPAAPASESVPPLMVMVLVDESAAVRTSVPVLLRVALPAGTGVLDSVSATLPLTAPAKVVVLVANTRGAFDWVTAPVNVIGLPVKATGVLLPLRATAWGMVSGVAAWSTPAVRVSVPVPRTAADVGASVPRPAAEPAFRVVPPEKMLIGLVRFSVPV